MDYPDKYKVRPITTWPGLRTPTSARKVAQFSAGMADTLELLDRELHYLRARDVTLEVGIPADANLWRNDGLPRAHARADHPGVVLRFVTPVGSLGDVAYATDKFLRWQDNLRAIAKTLEAQRMMERYGTAAPGQQHRGWKELPAPASSMNAAEAAQFLHEHGGGADLSAYRTAAKKLHPDLHGGDDSLMTKLNQAKEVLGL